MKSLAGLHQAQHQALMDMKLEQEDRFRLLVQTQDEDQRITRWYLALQPFKFKVVHRPGVQMAVADFLSRNGGRGAADRRAYRPETGGGGMWRGGRGKAERAKGERVRRRAGNQWASE